MELMRDFYFDSNIIEIIEALYKVTSSADFTQNNRTIFQNSWSSNAIHSFAGVLNVYLKHMMQETLNDYNISMCWPRDGPYSTRDISICALPQTSVLHQHQFNELPSHH